MDTTTVSPKYHVVTPLRVRRALGIRPGQKIQGIPYEGRIELIPAKPLSEARRLLKGIDTSVERETDRAGTLWIPRGGSISSRMDRMLGSLRPSYRNRQSSSCPP